MTTQDKPQDQIKVDENNRLQVHTKIKADIRSMVWYHDIDYVDNQCGDEDVFGVLDHDNKQ